MYSFTDAPDTASSDEEELVDDDDVVVFSVLPPHATKNTTASRLINKPNNVFFFMINLQFYLLQLLYWIVKYFSILFEINFTMFLVVNKKMYEKIAQLARKIVQFI